MARSRRSSVADRTGGHDDLVRQYLDEVGQFALLTAADEVALARRIEAGGEAQRRLDAGDFRGEAQRRQLAAAVTDAADARHHFIQANLRLVVSIAKRYQTVGLPLLDLIQEGNLGLMRAVEKFDHRKGFKFSTYATWWIRQAISRALADRGRSIRVPVHMVDTRGQISRSVADLQQRLGREPTHEELADDTGLAPARVRDALAIPLDPISLSATVDQDNDRELADIVVDDQAPEPADIAVAAMERVAIHHGMASLTERERVVLSLRFGLTDGRAHTLDDVGAQFHVTRERIRQIEAKALSKLRHPCSSAELRALATS